MPIITPRIRFIEKFLSRFSRLWRDPAVAGKSHFSKIQMEVFSAYNTTTNYQKLQYFFSESNWSIKEPNDIRIKILQNQRTTKANNKGVLAIDDTVCPKPYAEKTEGAQVQYCGPLGREENCVDFNSYLPITTPNPENFKSKLDLCLRADQRGYCFTHHP